MLDEKAPLVNKHNWNKGSLNRDENLRSADTLFVRLIALKEAIVFYSIKNLQTILKFKTMHGRDWCKKIDCLKILPLIKSPQYFSDPAEIQASHFNQVS